LEITRAVLVPSKEILKANQYRLFFRAVLCTVRLDNTYDIWYAFNGGEKMTSLTASQARALLYKLLDTVTASHVPVQITGKRSNAILISQEDWDAIQETLYLVSIPDMRESIRKGLKTPIEKCSEDPKW
jgi:prevent-host-death family protein